MPASDNNYDHKYDDDDEIDLVALWRTLVSYKWLIFGLTLLSTSVAIAYAVLATPIYRAEVLLAPATEKRGGALAALASQYSGLASFAGMDLGGGGDKGAQAIAMLGARTFTKEFIRDNNLLPILFYKKWDAEKKQWKVDNPKKVPTLNKAFSLFDGKVRSISEDKKTGLVTLGIEWKDRKLAAKWAQQLVQRINSTMRQRAVSEAQKSLAFLQQELQKTSVVEVQQAIYKLIEGQTKSMMLASVQEEYAFKVIDPPSVPDKGQTVKPKRMLIVIIGFVLGVIGGTFAAFSLAAIKRLKA